MKYLFLLCLFFSCSYQDVSRTPSQVIEKEVLTQKKYMVDNIKRCSETPKNKYDRQSFLKSIGKKTNNCLDYRRLVLLREKLDHRKFEQGEINQCEIRSGTWKDYFSDRDLKLGNDKFDKPLVSFTIPLRVVYYSGGHRWSKEKINHYVNNVSDREHHLVTNQSNNTIRSKWSYEEYKNAKFKRKCAYAGAWLRIKRKWGMCVRPTEINILKELEDQCIANYSRDEWKHWLDEDKDCMNSRMEALVRDSETSLFIQKVTQEGTKTKKCTINGGFWLDPYSGKEFKDAGKMDIDHYVPLKNAHVHGAWSWPSWMKDRYANSIIEKNHLITVSASENRSKSAQGPEGYLPSNEDYICEYLKNWVRIKRDWELSMNSEEVTSIKEKNKEYRCGIKTSEL